MPVWHEGTKKWVKEGKVILLGITQEQHADRCRLLAQWKGFDWPILHDPINVMEPSAVPVLTAIDEHGIVRLTRPQLNRFEADFLSQAFRNDARDEQPIFQTPRLQPATGLPDFTALRQRAEKLQTAAMWRELGDALVLWGGEEKLNQALESYTHAAKKDPRDGLALFRMGVCHRRRYETPRRHAGDFQAAIDHWGRALELNPNQYIWRRRIQQYGPRLDKPYAFYDWVEEAERSIRSRGEKPVGLAIRPGGAEIAHPARTFVEKPPVRSPDPEGKIHLDKQRLIQIEVTVAPALVRPGQAVRVHVVLRPDLKQKAHWNNEAEPVRLWVGPPQGWQVDERLLTARQGKKAVSEEEQTLDFEVKVPSSARGKSRLTAYVLYNVCDDRGGECRFLRQDLTIEIVVKE